MKFSFRKKPSRALISVLVFTVLVLFGALWARGYLPFIPWTPPSAHPNGFAEKQGAAPKASIPMAPASVAVAPAAAKAEPQPAPKPSPAATPKKAEEKTVAKALAAKAAPRAAAAPPAEKKRAVRPGLASESVVTAQATAACVQTTSFRWERFGADPYASSREEALAPVRFASALRALGVPEGAITLLAAAVSRPGEKTRIVVGDHLDAMLSKGGCVHRNVTVAFGSPARGMEYAAPAEKWTVTWEGKTYTILDPDVCHNLSLVIGLVPSPAMAPAPPSPPGVSAACPKGFAVYANAWTMDAMPDYLRQKVQEAIERAAARDSKGASDINAYRANDVSGGNPVASSAENIGDELIRVVNVRAPLNVDITAQILNPTDLSVTANLGTFRLTDGIARIPLAADQRLMVVQIIWPQWFVSPTVSGGLRRDLILPIAWVKANGGRWCTLQANAAFWERNRPR